MSSRPVKERQLDEQHSDPTVSNDLPANMLPPHKQLKSNGIFWPTWGAAALLSIGFVALFLKDLSWYWMAIPDVSESLLKATSGDRADWVRVRLGKAAFEREHDIESSKKYLNEAVSDLDGKRINNQVLLLARSELAPILLADNKPDEAAKEAKLVISGLEQPHAMQGGVHMSLWWYAPAIDDPADSQRAMYQVLAKAADAKGDTRSADANYEKAMTLMPGEKENTYTFFRALPPYVEFLLKHGRTADATKVTERCITDAQRNMTEGSQCWVLDETATAYARINDSRAGNAMKQLVQLMDRESECAAFRSSARIRFAQYLAKSKENDAEAEKLFREAFAICRNDSIRGKADDYTSTWETNLMRSSEALSDFLVKRGRKDDASKILQTAEPLMNLTDWFSTPSVAYPFIKRFDEVTGSTKYEAKISELEKADPEVTKDEWRDQQFNFFP